MKTLRLLALLLLAALTQPAFALYYCKCDPATAAATGCLDGSDAADGLTSTAAKQSFPTQTVINTAAAGTQFLFCKNGSLWDAPNIQLANTNSTEASPITFGTYTPSWGDGAAPWFRYGFNGVAFQFGVSGGAQTSGYVFDGLFLDGQSCATGADHAFTTNGTGVVGVTLRNMEVAHFALFMELQTPNAGRVTKKFRIQNSIIRDMYDIGFLGEADDIVFEGNTWSRNGGLGRDPLNGFTPNCGQGNSFGHHMYFSGVSGRNAVVRNNYYEKAGNGGTGGNTCTSGSITVHGIWNGMTFDHNTINNSAGEGANCGGIDLNAGYDSVNEAFSNIWIRGNLVINAGITASNSQNITIENNRVIKLAGYYGCCAFTVPRDDGNGPADVPMSGLKMRNNSAFYPAGSTYGTAFGLDSFSGHGNNAIFANNLADFGAGSTGVKCFSYGPQSRYTVADYNGCTGATWGSSNGTTYNTMTNARASSFFDLHSVNTDPQWLTTPTSTSTTWGLQIGPTSPDKNAGSNTYCARLDAIGYVRGDGTCDIGAREQGNGL